jgi:hypothetical protein
VRQPPPLAIGASMTPRPLLLALVAVAACSRPAGTATDRAFAEVTSCRECHEQIVASYIQTAHFNTSTEASAGTIKGPFADGRNVLQTGAEGISFTMEQRKDGFYQTAVDAKQNLSRSERFGVVIGSGRKGQSYLYWSQGVLLQLPVSWLSGVDQWINSPGYADGIVDFERIVPPRCLECHSTAFRIETVDSTWITTGPIARTAPVSPSTTRCRPPGSSSSTIAPCAMAAPSGSGNRRSHTSPVTFSATSLSVLPCSTA